jgi:HCOMODA/2-hydroxy-3-carboxy-muconic semialdehyde decarboxylase
MNIDMELLQRRVRVVARALGRHGLVQAWGHCSARIDEKHFLVCAPRAMGIIRSGEAGTTVAIDAPLPAGVLGEVRIHQKIYARRADVGGICRVMPPLTMALSTLRLTPRPRHGVGAFVDQCPLWDDPRLLRDDAMAAALAETLGNAPALVMRANGAVTVGTSVELAMAHAWCLEDAARIEHAVRSMTSHPEDSLLAEDEISARQVSSGRVFDRLWEFMTNGDPEAPPVGDVFNS